MGLFDSENPIDLSQVPWWRMVNLHQVEHEDGDSNEVFAAKAIIKIYCDLDGIADEMTYAEIDRVNEMEPAVAAACEVLRARDLL